MFTKDSYFRLLRIFLPLFVITLPLANRDIFSLFVSRIFPVRVVLVFLILASFVFLTRYLFFERKLFGPRLKVLLGEVRTDFVFRLLLALLIVRLISLVNSLNLKASLNLLLFYLSIVALYLIFKFVQRHEFKILTNLFSFHLAVVSLVALFGLVQLVLAFLGISLPGVLVGTTFVRIPATFYDANHLTPYLLTAFPSLLIYFFYIKEDFLKGLTGSLLAVFSLVSLFTFSRSGFLSLATAFLILLAVFLKRRYWRKLTLMALVLLFGSLVIFLTSQTQLSLFKRLFASLNLAEKSTVAHGILIYGGLDLLKKSPLIGLGYGSFSEHFRASPFGTQHAAFDPATQVRLPAHSLWLEVLVETGLIGFLLYLWLMATMVESCLKALRMIKDKQTFLNHLALVAAFLGLLAGGLFYSYNLEFFWFFIFLVYFRSLFLSAEAHGAPAAVVTDSDSETVDWRKWFYFLCLVIPSVSLIFAGRDFLPITPTAEGFYATVGKYIRRDWGYSARLWWVPHFDNEFFGWPPLPFWLNAFWTFLYDLGTSVPRFFPAFFATLAVLVLFLVSSQSLSLARSFLVGLALLASPLFLTTVRFGSVWAYVSFFSVAAFSLLLQLVRTRRTVFLLPLILMLGFFSLVSYSGYLLLVSLVFLILFYFSVGQRFFSVWLPFSLGLSGLPLAAWVYFLKRNFVPVMLSQGFLPIDYLRVIYFLLWPPLVFLVGRKVFGRRRPLWLVTLSFLILISFFFSLSRPTDPRLTSLVQKRLNLNRDGRVPLYLLAPPTFDAYYYSEVPIFELSLADLEQKIRGENHFYAIVSADLLRSLRDQGYVGFYTAAVSQDWALMEKPGRVD